MQELWLVLKFSAQNFRFYNLLNLFKMQKLWGFRNIHGVFTKLDRSGKKWNCTFSEAFQRLLTSMEWEKMWVDLKSGFEFLVISEQSWINAWLCNKCTFNTTKQKCKFISFVFNPVCSKSHLPCEMEEKSLNVISTSSCEHTSGIKIVSTEEWKVYSIMDQYQIPIYRLYTQEGACRA